MRLSKFRKAFRVDDQAVEVVYEVFVKHTRSSLSVDGREVAGDATGEGDTDLFRNHRLEATLGDGRELAVEVGPAGWVYGLKATVDGAVVFETHPGRTLGYGDRMQRFMAWAETNNTPEGKERQKAAWKRNWPSLAVDVAMAIGFFFVAREFGLVAAAVGGAVLTLVLWGVQRVSKVDLLGGLAVFGVVMSLVSAGFALVFQDDRIIQMRTTILGVIGAVPFLIDGMTGGQRLAARMARYLVFDVDAGRLGIGMGLIGLTLAGLNVVATALLSQDHWLIYSTFLDVPIALVLFVGLMIWAKGGPKARTY